MTARATGDATRRLLAPTVALLVAAGGARALDARIGDVLRRTNFRGRSVSLAGGPAIVGATVAGLGLAGADRRAIALTAVVGTVGLIDDLVATNHARGLRGHLAAARDGHVTTGAVKAVTAAGLGFLLARPGGSTRSMRLGARVREAVLIAGSANLVNLLDLRPGRALKLSGTAAAALTLSGDLNAPVVLAASAGLLPADLSERVMIGDCGANAIGALLGWVVARRAGGRHATTTAVVLIALNLASERVSFSSVIDHVPALRAIDSFGRARD